MNTVTLDRIIQLWPSLSEEARDKLVEIAESMAEVDMTYELSPAEELLLKQAHDDFKNGRTLSLDEFKGDFDAFFGGPRKKSKPL